MNRDVLHRHAVTANDRVHSRAMASADRIEGAIAEVWAVLLDIIRHATPHMTLAVHRRSVEALSRMRPLVLTVLRRDLDTVAIDTHRETAEACSELIVRRHVVESIDSTRKRIEERLFPMPSQSRIHAIIFGTGWEQRMRSLTALAQPDTLAAMIAQGVQQGETPDQIARRIRPAMQGVQSSARRVARTMSMHVAHEMQMDAYEQLGDMVTAYQIHSTHDQNVRPEHARRDGTIYYRHPKRGQESMEHMPRPPMEADGSLSHNCRCWLSPILGEFSTSISHA